MEYVELKLFRLEYVSVSFFPPFFLELVSTTLITQQGSIVHRLINSPVAVQQVQEVLDIHSELQGIALAPYIEEEILIELQIQPMMQGMMAPPRSAYLPLRPFR